MEININENFSATLNAEQNRWEVTLTGEIDIFNAASLKDAMLALLLKKECSLFVNCKQLTYLDSTALGALVGVLKAVKQFGGEIHMQQVRPNVQKVFKITNLEAVFFVEGDANE